VGLFTRHIKSTILLIAYGLWWTYVFYWFTSGASAYPNSCGAANGGLVILTLLIVAIYTLTGSILTITSKGQRRKDFLIFVGLILSPIVYVAGYLMLIS
jgi:hypothetical protein